MSNEREDFEKWSAEELPASYVKKHRTVLREVWQACAERKQREIDEIESRYVGIEEALATIGAERDALAALVERMRESMNKAALHVRPTCTELYDELRNTLSLTAPDALRERDAKVLEEAILKAIQVKAPENWSHESKHAWDMACIAVFKQGKEMAAAKERGE